MFDQSATDLKILGSLDNSQYDKEIAVELKPVTRFYRARVFITSGLTELFPSNLREWSATAAVEAVSIDFVVIPGARLAPTCNLSFFRPSTSFLESEMNVLKTSTDDETTSLARRV